jgi:hypothetical protein
MAGIARRKPTVDEQPDLVLVAEPDEVDPAEYGIDVERDIVVRLQRETRWLEGTLVYLGPGKPRIVLAIGPWDEEWGRVQARRVAEDLDMTGAVAFRPVHYVPIAS